MQVSAIPEFSAPVLVLSVILIVAMFVVLMLCVCGKQSVKLAANSDESETNRISTFLDAESLRQMQMTDEFSCVNPIDVETGITPLNTSRGENGAVHRRGNSVDLTKMVDRHSGASTGSSPRPVTICRELPDIPGKSLEGGKLSTLPDRGHHSVLPDIPSETGQKKGSSTVPSNGRTVHSTLPNLPSSSKGTGGDGGRKPGHGQLPNIPKDTHTSPALKSSHANSTRSVQSSQINQDEMDDYDHIEENSKKKSRPRSDYDHVVIEGGEKKIVLAKSKLNENDYAELQAETVPTTEEVMVIPVSKPLSNLQHKAIDKSKPVQKTNSFDDPYNKIKGDDTPYNQIKDDPPYNKIKEGNHTATRDKDDPYNKITVDDPYNTVKEEMDDLDPYNTVNEGPNSARSSGRQKQHFSFRVPVYDPYASVLDEERNVSNQTDPYARVADTEIEIDDPYNKVVEEAEGVVNSPVKDKISHNYTDDDYATVNKGGEVEVEYAKVNKHGAKKPFDNSNAAGTENNNPPSSPREEITHDEYATVVKVRKLNTGHTGTSNATTTQQTLTPDQQIMNDNTSNMLSLTGQQTVTVTASLGNTIHKDTARKTKSQAVSFSAESSTGQQQLFPAVSGSGQQQLIPSVSGPDQQQLFPAVFASGQQQLIAAVSASGQQQLIPAVSASGQQQLIPAVLASGQQQLIPAVSASGQQQLFPAVSSPGQQALPSARSLETIERHLGQQHVEAPPEPPRDYDDDNDADVALDGDHYNTVGAVSQDQNRNLRGAKKEPPYNKLSVRESLASMNARAASNTYEYVSELDNLYATVDGGSGDGIVGRAHQLSPIQQGASADLYAEIDAPAPPSLDSLHETAKQHLDEKKRKHDQKRDTYTTGDGSKSPNNQRSTLGQGQGQFLSDQSRSPHSHCVQNHSRTPSGHEHVVQGNVRTPSGQFRPLSADVMSSSFEGRVPIATAENVDLDFHYNSVLDTKTSDNVSEFDPNYETVEEAKAKLKYSELNGTRPKEQQVRPHIYEVPDSNRKHSAKEGETVMENGKIRAHVYEEVKEPSEARRVKQLVLSRHTYEEVTDPKNTKQQQNPMNSKVNTKKKEHQRNTSGEWSFFGKKKTGNEKDKSKETKSAADDKALNKGKK